MRILINDGLSAEGIAMLRNAGFTVDDIKIPQEELPAKIAPYDCIVVRSASKVTKEVIDAGKDLKVIVRGGVGVDNIDVKHAESKGIKVMNTPTASSASVAELALAHMFALSRSFVDANLTMRAGQWEKKKYAKGLELGGKTLGILGIGRIGKELAKRALALGMKVIAYDPLVKNIDLDVKLVSKEEVLKDSDFISLHIPKQPEGYAIGKEEIAQMKNGAYLINCARGGTVCEGALLEALNSGKLAGAGIDVFEKEPTDNLELVKHPKVSVTPHIGASTVEAQDRVGAEVAKLLKEFFKK
ncbi:MAG: 3-phosphoglycerate dehydrogenase [Calditrichaeota bacterium]|nr:3-phosphoglycerate dehydrogenase [Calditrichota bacterium]